MKKGAVIITLFVLAGLFYGCGKKQQPLEEMQQPMSMETLVTMSTTSTASEQVKAPEAKTSVASVLGPVSSSVSKLDPLPPSGPYKPTPNDIQTALKNAGFYTGAIDGKIGPNSKKAITEFQKSNDLVVDGKVGPKTWAVLSRYLSPVAQDSAKPL
ncbi:MAG: peptidoglycan-binding domain-containing protein [Candidatus Omnitrophota bacterium]